MFLPRDGGGFRDRRVTQSGVKYADVAQIFFDGALLPLLSSQVVSKGGDLICGQFIACISVSHRVFLLFWGICGIRFVSLLEIYIINSAIK